MYGKPKLSMGNFVCAMYGKPKLTHVNEARYATFQLSFVPRNGKEPLQKIKGINASMLSSCQSALYKKGSGRWKLQNEMIWGRHIPEDVWRILDADTEVLEEVETGFNDPVTDELLYRARWLPRFWWVLKQ